MGADYLFLSAAMLAIPMSMKYLLAFEIRKKVAVLRARERHVESMANRLEALEREQGVVHGALVQVEDQRRWAQTRQGRIEDELSRVRVQTEAQRRLTPTGARPRDAAGAPLTAAAEAGV